MIWEINHVVETDRVAAGPRSLLPEPKSANSSLLNARCNVLGPNNNLAADLAWRLNAFGPLPFNAAVDAHWIYGTH
jgi:hypothetical protein